MNPQVEHPLLMQIVAVVAAIFVIWLTVRMVRGNPGAFQRESISKSFFTMGVLALILIAFIAVCVWLLRNYS